ncbi:phospholipase D-like domain-containing protein [Salinigranum rubrum]|uniref:phospholipase D-like domain-containing protein n=1 Tax=Salinigranum rubrum TaxID=755307 RepID=UPI001FEA5648|nr:phospholipase D-like domain-containing protein [Salinigranum rubrum]
MSRSHRSPRSCAVHVALVALVVLSVVAGTSPAVSATGTATGPRIVSVYPNPLADGDVGEFVAVSSSTPQSLTLSDGERAVDVSLPGGTVALSADPTAARALTDHPVVGVPGLELANGGERLVLEREGTVVDTVVYESAPAGERLLLDADGERTEREWRPLGYEPRPVSRYEGAQATAFVLPDSPDVALDTLRAADDRVLLAGYTFTSPRVTRALVNASDRGVHVRVLVDDAPVGGLTTREARMLDRLAHAGVEVRVIGGEAARFSFHHPKYAVVDHTALVLTENWKPAGVGGRSSRGWGVRIDSPALASDLAALFASDIAGRDVTSWTRFRRGRAFTESDPLSEQTFETRHESARVRVDSLRLLTAPGNAEREVVRVIDDSEERLDVVQVSVERDHSFTRAAFDAARRGVEVRILLSGAWYVREENEATVEWLNRRAEREDLPLTAKLAAPGERFEKIHAKGVVADDTVLVGSLNWNSHSSRENREVVVALEGEAVSNYYREVFAADWKGGRGPVGWCGLLSSRGWRGSCWRGEDCGSIRTGDALGASASVSRSQSLVGRHVLRRVRDALSLHDVVRDRDREDAAHGNVRDGRIAPRSDHFLATTQ